MNKKQKAVDLLKYMICSRKGSKELKSRPKFNCFNLAKYYLFYFGLLTFTLCACGKKEDPIAAYEAQMNQFYETVNATSISINSIDSTSEDSVPALLEYLDDMNYAFQELTTYSVPEEYADAAELSAAAATYMSQADSLYHQAFANDTYDENIAAEAKENYEQAMNYANYIGQVLMGSEIERTDSEE